MENKKPTKQQHFVPRFLLENFTGRDGKLVQYTFKYKYYSHKFPSQICHRDFLYETKFDGRDKIEGNEDFVYINHIEKYFNKKEDVYAPCIKTVLDICSNPKNTNSLVCSIAHKDILASFSANILLRNPVIMNTAELGVKDSKLWQSNNVKIIIDILKYLGINNIDSIALAAKKDAWFDETLDNMDSTIENMVAKDLLNLDDLETRREQIKKVTIEDIEKVSKKVYLDTIYLLRGDLDEKK